MRALIHARGPDTFAFLQGLITANVNSFASQSSRTALYSAFLSPKGRIMHDVFLLKHPSEGIWIDCHRDAHSDILKYLKRHTLRSNVRLDTSESHKVVTVREPLNNIDTKSSLFTIDPRIKELGYRAIVPSDVILNGEIPSEEYKTMRFKLGIAEGPHELRTGIYLPHEVNLDYLNALDYRKGCYVGQELVIRTHHQGVVRKRLVPVLLSKEEPISPEKHANIDLLTDAEVMTEGKKVGKMVASFDNLGMAILKLDILTGNQKLQVATENGQFHVWPQPTPWWPLDK